MNAPVWAKLLSILAVLTVSVDIYVGYEDGKIIRRLQKENKDLHAELESGNSDILKANAIIKNDSMYQEKYGSKVAPTATMEVQGTMSVSGTPTLSKHKTTHYDTPKYYRHNRK